MDQTEAFETERPRLRQLAGRVLGDHAEAEDVVQQAWLRLHRTDTEIDSLPAWLTTVTTRLCLDRLRARVPTPVEEVDEPGPEETSADPADDAVLADTVGLALHVVLDRLTPRERVAFVLHDSFGFDFPTVAAVLDTTPTAARKLASRARAKVAQPRAEDRLADWQVVDAFMAAARGGDLDRLLQLLAPDAVVGADDAAVRSGTPREIVGRDEVAAFFDGSAAAALPVFVGERPGAAWFHLGEAKVVFDVTVADGFVRSIIFRAEPGVLALVVRRDRGGARLTPVTPGAPRAVTPPRDHTTRETRMKTMTCRDLGGPCDLAHHGASADDVINAQDAHLKEAEKAGDATHQEARDAMKGRWRHPKRSMDWYRDTKAAFTALPED